MENKNEILKLDELIKATPTFKKIIEDGVIEEAEIKAQSDKVMALIESMKTKYNEEQLKEIKNLVVEAGVLNAACNFQTFQKMFKR